MRWLLVALTLVSLALAQYEQPDEHGNYGNPSKIFGEANERKAQEHLDGGLLPPADSVNAPGPDPLAGYGREPPASAENPGTEPLPPGPASPPGGALSTGPAAPGEAASTDDKYVEAPKATVDSSAEATTVAPETASAEQTTGPAAPEETTGATDSYSTAAPEAGNGMTEGAAAESSQPPAETTQSGGEQSMTEATSPAPEATNPPAEGGYENGAAPSATDAEKPSAAEEGPAIESTPAPEEAPSTETIAAPASDAPKESYNAGSEAPAAVETTGATVEAGQTSEEALRQGYNAGSSAPVETSSAPVETTATESAGQASETPKEEGYAGEKAPETETPAETTAGPAAPEVTAPAETSASEGPAPEVSTVEAPASGSSPAAPTEGNAAGQSYPETSPSGEQTAAAEVGQEAATEATGAPEVPATAAPAEAEQPKEEGYAGGQAAEEKSTEAPAAPVEETTAAPTEVAPSAATEQSPTGETVATTKSEEIEGSGSYEVHGEGSGAAPSSEEIPPHPPVGEAAPTSSGETSQEAKYSEAVVQRPLGSGEKVEETGKTVEGSGYTSSEKATTADKSVESSGTPEEVKPDAAKSSKIAAGSYEEPTKHLEDRSTDHFVEETGHQLEEDDDEGPEAISVPRKKKAEKIDGEAGPAEQEATSSIPSERTTVLEDIILHNHVDEKIKRKYTEEDNVETITDGKGEAVVDGGEETDSSEDESEEKTSLRRVILPKPEKKEPIVVIKPISERIENVPFNSAEVIVSYREDTSTEMSFPVEEEAASEVENDLPDPRRVIIMKRKHKTELNDGKKTITEMKRLNLGPHNSTIIGGRIDSESADEPDVRKKIKKMHKLRRLRVVHRSRSTTPFSARDLPTYSGDKNLGTEDKVIAKEDKYVTAPGERVSTPGVTIPPEASKTDKPADWNTVSPTVADNPVTTEPINSLFSIDTTNKMVEPSGYEMGNEPAISTPDMPPIKPEEAVGYDGIPKDDVKKDLPQQTQQDLNRSSGEVKFVRKQNNRAEKKYKWTPYRFDCATEEDDKGLLCNEWAQAGLCEQHRPTMFLFCRKTCLCTGPRKKRSILRV